MTGWRTSPCVVSDACMNKLLGSTDEHHTGQSHYFARVSSSEEMTRITLSYATRVGAREIRFARCGSFVWVRLDSDQKSSDLVFDSPNRPDEQVGARPFASLEISAGTVSERP